MFRKVNHFCKHCKGTIVSFTEKGKYFKIISPKLLQ